MQKFYAGLTGLLLAFPGSAFAQTPTRPDSTRQKHYTYTEKMPVFPVLAPGDSAVPSNQRFMRFVNDDVHFPVRALRDGISGKVFFAFAVNTQGRTQDIKLVKGLRADVDAEVLRNAHRLDAIQWEPGTQNGRPVTVSFTVPISFDIDAKHLGQSIGDSLDTPAFNKMALPGASWSHESPALPPDRGVVYGSCIQRLGFESGGFGQYVRLANLSTGKAVRIEVKPALRSRKQNAFCIALPPGRYALCKYEFTASKWYGGEMHQEPLHKPAAAVPGQGLRATRYLFMVRPGQLHYVGTWNLEQEDAPIFLNDKAHLDTQLTPIFKSLSFPRAVVALPE